MAIIKWSLPVHEPYCFLKTMKAQTDVSINKPPTHNHAIRSVFPFFNEFQSFVESLWCRASMISVKKNIRIFQYEIIKVDKNAYFYIINRINIRVDVLSIICTNHIHIYKYEVSPYCDRFSLCCTIPVISVYVVFIALLVN